MTFYRNETIERIAQRRLDELARCDGRPITFPIPIDRLAEAVLGLDFLWEEIEELPGETILGGLDVERRLIVLNAGRQALFASKPGLERSTKGHEMGHWDLFVNRAMLGQDGLPGLQDGVSELVRRSQNGQITILADRLRDPYFVEIAYQLLKRADQPDVARTVNRYAAAIAMPRDLLRAEYAAIDPTNWPDRYALAKRCDVTISALNVRLEQLDLSYVADREHIHRSKRKALGQLSLEGF